MNSKEHKTDALRLNSIKATGESAQKMSDELENPKQLNQKQMDFFQEGLDELVISERGKILADVIWLIEKGSYSEDELNQLKQVLKAREE